MLPDAQTDAAARDLMQRMGRCFSAPPIMTVDEWADKYREMSKVANAKGGKWKSRCFQREIQRETTNRECRSVVFVAAAQTGGKSEVHLNFIGRQIHLNPGPMMLVQPTNELAERFSKKRVQPMMRDTAILRPLCGDVKSRNGQNTIRQKEFPGGCLNIAGANTPNELCSDPIRDVMIDEVDRCEEAAGREGDIVTLAEQRQESFGEDAFSFYTSTPSGAKPRPNGDTQPAGVSKIMLLFAESDQRYWFCPCRRCGRHQTLKWAQVQWPKNEPAKSVYVCEFSDCKHEHNDTERIAMIHAGEWRATEPFSGRRGYFLNGIYSLSRAQRGCVNRLHQMSRDFLRAKRRGTEALRAWVNTFLCECFDDEGAEGIEPTPLFKRREKFGDKLPEGVLFLTAGVDVHPDRIEAQLVGWGIEEEAWNLEYEMFLGDTKKAGVYQLLDKWLLRGYEHQCGKILHVERFAMDTGNSTDEVYNFCRDRVERNAIAIRGIPGYGLPVMNLPKKTGVRKVRLWLASKNTSLKTLHARLKIQEPGEGFIHFRRDRSPMFEEEYFKQLTANDVVTIKRAGVELQEFNPRGRRDEAADTWIYALAALRKQKVEFEKLKKRMEAKPEEPEKEPAIDDGQSWATVAGWK